MASTIRTCTGSTGGTGDYIQQNIVNVECTASQLIGPVNATMASMIELLNSTKNIETKLETMLTSLSNIYTVLKHEHDAHMHSKPHNVDKLEGVTGYRLMPDIIGLSDRLMQEFSSNVDKDENGLIYGFDFIIDNTDPKIPPCLSEMNIVILESGYVPKLKITWNAYLETIPKDAQKV